MILLCVEQELSAVLRAVDSLFRRFAIKVLVVGLRVVAGMVDNAVPMIRGRIERIELQWTRRCMIRRSHYFPKTFLT